LLLEFAVAGWLSGFLAGGVYANICPGRKKLKHEMAKAKRQTLSNCRRHPPAAGGGPEVEVEVEAEAEAFTRQQHPHQSQSQSQSEAPTSTQYQINTENIFWIFFYYQNMYSFGKIFLKCTSRYIV